MGTEVRSSAPYSPHACSPQSPPHTAHWRKAGYRQFAIPQPLSARVGHRVHLRQTTPPAILCCLPGKGDTNQGDMHFARKMHRRSPRGKGEERRDTA